MKNITTFQTEQSENNTKNIELKEGYLSCPKDWIILDELNSPADCLYAGVVATRPPLNGTGNIQTNVFVFFSNYQYGKDYPAEMESIIYDECVKKDPGFSKILGQRVTPVYDEDKHSLLNQEEYMAAYEPGLFHIDTQEEVEAWKKIFSDYCPPYGAVIIR